MRRKIGRLLYGDDTYYIAHILLGIVLMTCIAVLMHFIFQQPLNVVLCLISDDIVSLSAALLGFQLAGVSILISLDGNKKLALLKEIESDTMIMKIFISSISMFLFSIILMLMSQKLLPNVEGDFLWIKTFIDYGSVVFFFFGLIFLFSSIRLLKWFCSK